MNVVEELQEFWQMKAASGTALKVGGGRVARGEGGDLKVDRGLPRYTWEGGELKVARGLPGYTWEGGGREERSGFSRGI